MTVRLRRATPEDAPFLHSLRAEPTVRKYQPIAQQTIPELEKNLRARRDAPLGTTLDGKSQWIILLDEAPAGWKSLDVTSREHGTASVGYSLAPFARGRMAASTALRQLVDLAFDPSGLDLHRLEANVAVANVASQRVLEAAGFQREGIARGLLRIDGAWVDHDRYGLLSTDVTKEHA